MMDDLIKIIDDTEIDRLRRELSQEREKNRLLIETITHAREAIHEVLNQPKEQ